MESDTKALGNVDLTRARRITLDAQLARAARRQPDTPAIKFEGLERTYGELDSRVTALAKGLVDLGLQKGDRVAVMMQNGIEVIKSYFAVIRAGGVCVPVNFRFQAAEVDYILEQSGAAIALCDKPSMGAIAAAPRIISGKSKLISTGVTGDDGPAEAYESIISKGQNCDVDTDVRDHDPAFIMYTSGTTGKPKGAVLTHMNLFVNTINMISAIEIRNSDRRWLAGLPLFHIGGLNGILPFLYFEGTSVILPNGNFNAEQVVDLLERERITSCFFVPTQWQAICDLEGTGARNFCLERATWGASPSTPSIIEAIHRTFPNARTYNVFGQTEMSSVTCVMRVDQAPEKVASIGKPVPGVEVRLVDDDMCDVPDGDVGEIVYRGPTVMQGYWQKPDATEEAFQGGWFHSGDLVRRDADGFYYVADRKTDMIISGGENIYCPEVENAIDAHPDVKEVAVVGAPHPKWIETPVAFVVRRDGATLSEDTIIAFCKDRLASYKKPTAVHFIEALPRNPSGKVLKTKLKQLLVKD